jgi:Rrf2 family protein
MQLTRAADYGVRVMIHLAGLPPGSRATRAALAEAAGAADDFVSKVLQDLVRAGLITSHRGKQGGFELACSGEETSLLDVVEAIDGAIQLNLCVGRGRTCERQGWCAAHQVWVEAQQAMRDVLRRATLSNLARQSQYNRSRGEKTMSRLPVLGPFQVFSAIK